MMGRDSEAYLRQNRSPTSVLITLTSGATLRGSIMVSKTKTMAEELNRGEPFIEFETQDGERMFLARSVIGTVRETNMPKVDALNNKLGETEKADPYAVLHVDKNASASEVRHAYLQLAKTYHPDRFARVELPMEVLDYLSAMATRINLAYAQLKSGDQMRGRAEDAA